MSRESDTAFIWLAVPAALLLWSFWDSPTVIGVRYGVDSEKVIGAGEPHDCDFWTAPIGRKHCSYEAQYQKDKDGWLYVSYAKNLE